MSSFDTWRKRDVPLYLQSVPGESYHTWLRSLLLCLCYAFWALINSFLCWFWRKKGYVPFKWTWLRLVGRMFHLTPLSQRGQKNLEAWRDSIPEDPHLKTSNCNDQRNDCQSPWPSYGWPTTIRRVASTLSISQPSVLHILIKENVNGMGPKMFDWPPKACPIQHCWWQYTATWRFVAVD